MTTVVAYAKGEHTIMAADTMTNVYDRPVPSARKIMRIGTTDQAGQLLLGCAGSGAAPALIEAQCSVESLPDFENSRDRNAWATAVASTVTGLYLEHQLVDGGLLDGTLLLASHGYLWTLTHHQAIAHPDGMAAIGSGEGPALGALHALIDSRVAPKKAVEKACEIGIRLDRYSGGPIQLMTT